MNFNILDCTIRDGGHLCKWEFEPICVKESYYAALRSGASYFEIGYRNPKSKTGLGAFGYCDDDFLLSLFKPSDNCKVTLMIDAGKADGRLFVKCDPAVTPVKAVRVAAYPYEFEKAIRIVEDLYDKGYEVFMNLMACSEIKDEEYEILKNWKSKVVLTSLNFADSFGSFITKDITFYINKLRNIGFESIGFHSHNNLQMAFANTLKAIEEGASFVDASIYGMGRGAGNLPIEVLIAYCEKNGYDQYNAVPYLDIIDRYYIKIFEKIGWGYGLSALMSGIKNIHPYYVTNLLEKGVYTIDEVWNALDTIKEKCPVSFSEEQLNEALVKRFYTPLTQEKVDSICEEIKEKIKIIPVEDSFEIEESDLIGKHRDEKFLIIANGPSVLKYQSEIERFVKENHAITIGVNYLNNLFVPDYHMFVSKKRFLKYSSFINRDSILLVPTFWGKSLLQRTYNGPYEFFNLKISENYNDSCIEGITQKCVNLNVAISSILMAYQMGASEIFVVGMDGYIDEMNKKMVYFYDEEDNIEDKEIASVKYGKLSDELNRTVEFIQQKAVSFSIITPTSYKKYYKKTF